jgi:hypothetical protein
MIQIRRGITRTVLLVGPWAVKLPSLRSNGKGLAGRIWSVCHGILANLSEVQWSEVDGVCPVRFSLFGLVNVYPRCEPVASFDGDYAAIGAPFLPPLDRKPENLGLLNGRLVWVDYT